MKITVCELGNDPRQLEADWLSLVSHVHSEGSQLVLLPEMAFYPWLAYNKKFDSRQWQLAMKAHEDWLLRFPELSPALVCGTRPVIQEGKRLNEALIWHTDNGCQAVHHKYYLPDEEGFWEASWYQRGEKDFSIIEVKKLKIGFLICTELWFSSHARQYGKQGAHLVLCPRATPASTADKWVAGGRAAAVVAGAYCLSSNFSGLSQHGNWAGSGWGIDPDGVVLGITSQEQPFKTIDIDLERAEAAKNTYPRYVLD